MKKLFVFDLDFTIWDAGGTWCDATSPPYVRSNEEIYDSIGRHISLYPDVKNILHKLKSSGKFIAAASRTFQPDWAKELLVLTCIDDFFDKKEIYPDSKISHFKKLKIYFGLEYSEMVFFDDEFRNIREVGKLGVECVHVENGLDWKLVEQFV